MANEPKIMDRAGAAVQDQKAAAKQKGASSAGDRGAATADAEELRKQIANVEAERDRAKAEKDRHASDLARVQAEKQKLEEQNANLVAQNLSKLAEAVSQNVSGSAKADEQAQFKALAEKLRDAEAEDWLGVMAAYANDATTKAQEQAVKRMRDEVVAPLLQQIEEDRRRMVLLEKQVLDNDPSYLARKEHMAELGQRYNLDPNNPEQRKLLLKLSEDLKPDTPGREMPPGLNAGHRVIETEQSAVTDEARAYWKTRGITDDGEIAKRESLINQATIIVP